MVGGGYLAFMENPTSIWEVGLLFAEKCDTVCMVLPINGKRAAPLAPAGGYTSFCCPLTQRKGGHGYGYILGIVPVLYSSGQCYQPRYQGL